MKVFSGSKRNAYIRILLTFILSFIMLMGNTFYAESGDADAGADINIDTDAGTDTDADISIDAEAEADTYAETDTDADEEEIDNSLFNESQSWDLWLLKGQSYDLADYSYSYDSDLFTVDAKGKLTAGKTEGSAVLTIRTMGALQEVTVEVTGKGKAVVDTTAKKITIGKGKKLFIPGQSKYSLTLAVNKDNEILTGKAASKIVSLKGSKIKAKADGCALIRLSGLIDNEYDLKILELGFADKKLLIDIDDQETVLNLTDVSYLPVDWETSDPDILSVYGNTRSAEIKPLSAGSAYVYATINGKRLSCKVKVNVPKEKVSATAVKLSTEGKGKTRQLSVKGVKNGSINWVSEDPAVVTVDEKGKITAVNPGETYVNAVSKDGSKTYGSVKVWVMKIDVGTDLKVALGGFAPVSMSIDDIARSETYNIPVYWKTSKASVATVNSYGYVRGIRKGKAKLTAKICGVKYTVNVEVTEDIENAHTHHYWTLVSAWV